MSITSHNIVGTEKEFKDLVYNTLKAVEPGANWLKPKVMSGNSGITIGIGFDLKNASDAVRTAVLQAMGFQTYLLIKDPTKLSASEIIEVNHINQLLELVKDKDLTKVNGLMKNRAKDQALIAAMKAEGKNYELRGSFYFRDEKEVRLVWDKKGTFRDKKGDVHAERA